MLLSLVGLLTIILIKESHGQVPDKQGKKDIYRRQSSNIYSHNLARNSVEQSNDTCEKEEYEGDEKHVYIRGDGKPARNYYIYTPANYIESEEKTKVILAFHGWGDGGQYYTEETEKILDLADKYNYAIVAFDGLTGDLEDINELYVDDYYYADTQQSWTAGGTSTGLQPDGETPTCDLDMYREPKWETNFCYTTQCECKNRCGYSHCGDDDIQMIADFLGSGELKKKLCYDENAVFAMGNSNGGIFTWNLAQDDRTAKFLAGIAPIIAAPVCGYNFKGEKAPPVISLVGRKDPTHPVYTTNPNMKCNRSSKSEGGYYFVTSHKITTTFAKGAQKCKVTNENRLPNKWYKFKGLKQLKCRTWCRGKAPFSLDCHYRGNHEDMPGKKDFVYEATMMFFDSHFHDRV